MINKLPLMQSDLETLVSSFVTPDLAEEAGLFRVDDLQGAEIVGRTRKAGTDYSGVTFPYFLPEQPHPRQYRLRRDMPDQEQQPDGTVKEKGKYLTAPGAKNEIYFPPNCRNEYLADVALDIVITEGEKKVLALHRVSWFGLSDTAEKPKFLPLGLSGVWNFRGTIGKTTNPDGTKQDLKGLIPDFHLISWANRKVTILFDANVATNPDVYFARLALAKTLQALGAIVFLAELPKGGTA